MSKLGLLKHFGIEPLAKDGINFREKIATQGHEKFNLYSRHVTVADGEGLSLPPETEGFCVVFDHNDASLFIVNVDGTVTDDFAETQGVAGDGTGNIQIGDLASNDAAQIKNTSGGSMDLRAYYFYR